MQNRWHTVCVIDSSAEWTDYIIFCTPNLIFRLETDINSTFYTPFTFTLFQKTISSPRLLSVSTDWPSIHDHNTHDVQSLFLCNPSGIANHYVRCESSPESETKRTNDTKIIGSSVVFLRRSTTIYKLRDKSPPPPTRANEPSPRCDSPVTTRSGRRRRESEGATSASDEEEGKKRRKAKRPGEKKAKRDKERAERKKVVHRESKDTQRRNQWERERERSKDAGCRFEL